LGRNCGGSAVDAIGLRHVQMTNQEIIDAAVGHQIDVQFYANGVVRQEVGQLNDDDEKLLALLLAALLALPAEQATPARIDAILTPILQANGETYRGLEQSLNLALQGATEAESAYQEQTLSEVNPDAQQTPIDAGMTFLQMLAVPMLGATIAETMKSLSASRAAAIRKTVQAGYVSGLSVEAIVRSVKTDVLPVSLRNLESVVRTAIAHAVDYASSAFYALNADLVGSVIWLSVLDGRTTPQCIARSGKRYTADDAHRPIGHSVPWGAGPGRLHWGCRSTFAPLVRGEVPKDTTYDQWLKRQDAQTQDEVLGPTRGRQYRKDNLSIDAFTNNKGKWLTLDQLRNR
jgi:SPP1 gp7 family putative phage head morphogenesis protein